MSKYLTYNDAKKVIAKFQFKTLVPYRQYIKNNGIKNLPLDPSCIYYTKGYRTSDFLGLSEEVYKQNLKQSRIIQTARMRSFITAESHIKRMKTRKATFSAVLESNSEPELKFEPVLKSEQLGLDPDKVISYLMDADVEPEIIVKMIADLEINSGTLMAELCKYMTKKTLEKQASWRPTGYNTAETQMSMKIW